MKYVMEERFTDDLGVTFEKAHSGGYGKPHAYLYFMREDDSRSVFEIIEKSQYDTAYQQYRQAFKAQMSARAETA
jgi:hypothetical protein